MRKFIHYAVWTLVAILYAPVFYDLYHGRWEMIDYTHAYFILPVSLWLVWRSRETLRHCDQNAMRKIGTVPKPLFSLVAGLSLFLAGQIGRAHV